MIIIISNFNYIHPFIIIMVIVNILLHRNCLAIVLNRTTFLSFFILVNLLLILNYNL